MGTSGNYRDPNVDYFLSSKLLEIDTQEAQKHYSEKLILCDYLPMYLKKPNIKKLDDRELKSNNIYSCPQTLLNYIQILIKLYTKFLRKIKAKIFFIKDKNGTFYKKIWKD